MLAKGGGDFSRTSSQERKDDQYFGAGFKKRLREKRSVEFAQGRKEARKNNNDAKREKKRNRATRKLRP